MGDGFSNPVFGLKLATSLINSTLSNVIALAISNQGVPAIDRPQTVSIVFNQNINAGATYTSPRLDFSRYQSVVGTFFAQEASAGVGTDPWMRVRLSWSLQADNYDPLITEDWVPAVGPFSFVHNDRNDYSSPCYGDTLTIDVFNYDSKAINLTWGLFGSYRARNRSVMRGRYPDDLTSEASGLGSDNIMMSANFAGALAPNTNVNLGTIQLWEGPVTISGTLGGPGVASNQQYIGILPQPNSILGSTIAIPNTGGTGVIIPPTSLILPRRACTLFLHSNNTAVANVTVAQIVVIGQVQPN